MMGSRQTFTHVSCASHEFCLVCVDATFTILVRVPTYNFQLFVFIIRLLSARDFCSFVFFVVVRGGGDHASSERHFLAFCAAMQKIRKSGLLQQVDG